ncbi:MAG: dienelactone hydrolase family protein [Acidobacteriaceae bacterium]
MSEYVKLKTTDGHELSAYVAHPAGEPKAALVLVQEIFGINAHIRATADGYAKDGFLVVAPATMDRIAPGIELTYAGDDLKRAFELYPKLKVELAMLDVAAAFKYADEKSGKKVGIIGYCFGGLTTWVSACRMPALGLHPAAAVGYYAGGIGNFAKEKPACPVMLHFGANDSHIGKEQSDAVRAANPEVEIYLYEGAGHAFNRDVDPNSYHAPSAKLARERSVAFLTKHLIG